MAKRTIHDIDIRTRHFCPLRQPQFQEPLRVDCLSNPTLILKERSDQTASSPHGYPRCHFLGQHLVGQAGAPGEPRCASSRACWARSVLRQWTRDGWRQLSEPLRHLHTPAPVLWSQLLTNLFSAWMEAQVFAQDRVQWGSFQSETEPDDLQTSPGYPGRIAPPVVGYPLSAPSEFWRCSFSCEIDCHLGIR